MFFGLHVLLFSKNPEADRAFFRDVLGFSAVDVGHGWLIFGMPPSEMAVHPAGDEAGLSGHAMSEAHLYLMCDDLKKTMQSLKAKNIECTDVRTERWGIRTTIQLPSGGEIGLYQPTHEIALKRKKSPANSRSAAKKVPASKRAARRTKPLRRRSA
jgi:catechol 2,3-dioxygenase-like lactoylglutathione lyase family enzyme